MATVDKVYHFSTNDEGIVDQGSSANIAFSYDGGNGSPATGCLKVADTAAHASQTEYAYRTTTGETWVTWGVPSGATVTSIQIVSWNRKQTASSILATSQNIGMDLIGSGGSSIIAAETVNFSPAIGAPDISWHADTSGTSQTVNSGSKSTGTDVRLRIRCTLNTTGDITPGFSFLMDEITIRITYTPPITWMGNPQQLTPPTKKKFIDMGDSNFTSTQMGATATVQKGYFAQLPDNRGASWRTEIYIADADPGSMQVVQRGNQHIAIYSIGGIVKVKATENPDSWGAVSGGVTITGLTGTVKGAAVNDAGIICVSVDAGSSRKTAVSRDGGRTWDISSAQPWASAGTLQSVAHEFYMIITPVGGTAPTHYISGDGGTTWI